MSVHYHLDGVIAHPGTECNFCEKKFVFLFNVMTSVEVEANDEEEAYDILNDNGGEIIDRDVMLVEMNTKKPKPHVWEPTEDSFLEMEYEDRFRSEEE